MRKERHMIKSGTMQQFQRTLFFQPLFPWPKKAKWRSSIPELLDFSGKRKSLDLLLGHPLRT